MKVRKKPVEVEAIYLHKGNVTEVLEWVEKLGGDSRDWKLVEDGLQIPTLEGIHVASFGDYIICGVAGEFYGCKPAIFHETYEIIEE